MGLLAGSHASHWVTHEGFSCPVCTALPQPLVYRPFSLLKSKTLFPLFSPFSKMFYIPNVASLSLEFSCNYHVCVNSPCTCIKLLFSSVNLSVLLVIGPAWRTEKVEGKVLMFFYPPLVSLCIGVQSTQHKVRVWERYREETLLLFCLSSQVP